MSLSRVARTFWFVVLAVHLSQVDLAAQAGKQTAAAMFSTATCPDCLILQAGLYGGKVMGAPPSRAVGTAGWHTGPLQESEEDGSAWGWVRTGGVLIGAVSVGYTTACTVKELHGLGRCALEGITVGVGLPILAAVVVGLAYLVDGYASSSILDPGSILTPTIVAGETMEIGLRFSVSAGAR